MCNSASPLISLNNVSVTYKTILAGDTRGARRFLPWSVHWGSTKFIRALDSINLSVEAGQRLAVVGRNGAGKSTLLKTLGGILEPSNGTRHVNGSIGSLLSITGALNRRLTGRDNIMLAGLAMGHTRESIQLAMDDVITFAEIGEFIDMPMTTYSAGMATRLGFAIATSRRPDVLLVDEVFATGDAAFQEKARARIQELTQELGALVLASHSAAMLREYCTTAIWLGEGRIRAVGDVEEVIDLYMRDGKPR